MRRPASAEQEYLHAGQIAHLRARVVAGAADAAEVGGAGRQALRVAGGDVARRRRGVVLQQPARRGLRGRGGARARRSRLRRRARLAEGGVARAVREPAAGPSWAQRRRLHDMHKSEAWRRFARRKKGRKFYAGLPAAASAQTPATCPCRPQARPGMRSGAALLAVAAAVARDEHGAVARDGGACARGVVPGGRGRPRCARGPPLDSLQGRTLGDSGRAVHTLAESRQCCHACTTAVRSYQAPPRQPAQA